VDFDLDGDIDILISNNQSNPKIYKNTLNDETTTNYLFVQVKGQGSVQHSIGSRVYVTTGDITQMREIRIENNFMGQQPLVTHFGLEGVNSIDEVRVVWPSPIPQTKVYTDVNANQYFIAEPDSD